MIETREKIDASQLDLKDTVVNISRVTKVVKGGKNLSFSALVVVGDGHGVVGFGVGKAKEVPSAIKKGIEAAKKSLIRVPLQGRRCRTRCSGASAPARCCSSRRRTAPASSPAARCAPSSKSCGIQNVLTKSIGSANSHNVVRATFAGLMGLKDPGAVRRLRGKEEQAGDLAAATDDGKTMAKKTQRSRRRRTQGEDHARAGARSGSTSTQAATSRAWACAASATRWSWSTRPRRAA